MNERELRELLLTKYEDLIVDSPRCQPPPRSRKPGGGESLPGPALSLQDLGGVQELHTVVTPSHQQDLDNDHQSHWSRSNEARLSLVDRFLVLLAPASYAINNQLGHPKSQVAFACSSLVNYCTRIVGFHPRNGSIYFVRPYVFCNKEPARSSSRDSRAGSYLS